MKRTKNASMDFELLQKLRLKKEHALRAAHEPAPSVEAAEEEFYRNFLKAAIDAALQRLSDHDRELIGVIYLPGPDGVRRTITELAHSRGVSRKSLYRRLALCLLELRGVLRERC